MRPITCPSFFLICLGLSPSAQADWAAYQAIYDCTSNTFEVASYVSYSSLGTLPSRVIQQGKHRIVCRINRHRAEAEIEVIEPYSSGGGGAGYAWLRKLSLDGRNLLTKQDLRLPHDAESVTLALKGNTFYFTECLSTVQDREPDADDIKCETKQVAR
jgi:hypothetical protein